MTADEPRSDMTRDQVQGHVPGPGPEPGGEDERLAALEDQLKRVAADFDNFRKRAAREREELVVHANERLVKELLPVLDDLERALEAAAEHEEAKR